jgi:hypothetical protein
MRLQPLFSLIFMSALTLACAKPCRVIWTEGPTNPETGKAVHTMEIQNPPKGTDWTLWFCQFRTPVNILTPTRKANLSSFAMRPVRW